MIRFLDLSNQISDDKFNFAWYDTVIDQILSFSGETAWSSWNDFEEDFLNSETDYKIDRFKGLFPLDKLNA